MMIKSKFLGDAAWKDLAAKNKVKDNGLLKALERLKRVDDDEHDEKASLLQEIAKLAMQLKKDRAVAALAPVAKYLAEVQGDAETAMREAAKERAEHEKAHKAKAEAEKKAAAKRDDDDTDADDDDEGLSPELLTTKLKPLLRLVAKGETMHTLVAKSGKRVVVMLSRKPIPQARRKLLAEELGGGSTKYYPGTCSLEAGATTFTLKSEVAGMAKLVKLALLDQTGLRLNKLKCRGDDGDDHDDDDDAATPSMAQKGEQAERASSPKAAAAASAPASAAAAPAPPTKPAATASASAASGIAQAVPVAAPPSGTAAVPLMAPGGMKDEEIAAAIMDKQIAVLEGWKTALTVFDKTMTSSADADATPDYQKAVLDYFTDKLMGELVKRAPGMSEMSALLGAIKGDYERAAKASDSATLRDFVNQHARAIGKLVQTTLSQRQGFISAVRARREAAGVDEPSAAAPARAGNKKPVGKVEVNPKNLEAWTEMRVALVDTLAAVEKVLGDSSSEKLLRVLTEAWVQQSTVRGGMGIRFQAMVIIRLNPDRSMRNAHIQGSGGQKLAEELLKEFPDGVDVFGMKTPRRIVHYADNGWPQTSLELDANNRDLSKGSIAEGDTGGLYKYVMSKGLPPTKILTGD